MIQGGHVKVDGVVIAKAGALVSADAEIVIDRLPAFVGRGGDKLEAALRCFEIEAAGRVCLDVGASTGGFTDCLLQHGAAKVYAVENGRGQLADVLLRDTRVVSMEETDIRTVDARLFREPLGLAVVDVSFISLKLVLAPVKALLQENADILCLVKPQFEAGRGKVSKRGIVRDAKVRQRALEEVISFAKEIGLSHHATLPYPDPPPRDKNQEYLIHLKT